MKFSLNLVVLVAISLLFVQCESNRGNTDIKEEATGVEAGHAYVDLGLPSGLKWATCNVGATTPKEYGDYFAWGEVESKETYYWETYKWGLGYSQLIKYCTQSSSGLAGFSDYKTILDSEDDAATANWGGKWRMPTRTEYQELIDNCTWIWTTEDSVNGYKVIGKNRNSIFLPAGGFVIGDIYDSVGSRGCYWSSSLRISSPGYAYNVCIDSDHVGDGSSGRSCGFAVRPVCQ